MKRIRPDGAGGAQPGSSATPAPTPRAAKAQRPLHADELSTGKGRALRQRVLRAEADFAASPPLSASPKVSEAAEAVASAAGRGGPLEGARELERQLLALPPTQRAALLRALWPKLTQWLRELAQDKQAVRVMDALLPLSHAAEAAGPEMTAELGRLLAEVIPDGQLGNWDNGLSEAIRRGFGSQLALATAAALRAAGKLSGARDVERAVVEGVRALKDDYRAARAEKARLEQRLQSDLASFGAAMSPEERERYVAAFWAEHHQAVEREAALGDRLATVMHEVGPKLEAMTLAGDHDAGRALLDAWEQLSASPAHARESIAWLGRLSGDGTLVRKLKEAAGDDLEARLEAALAEAVPLAQKELLALSADKPDGPRQALAELNRLLGDIRPGALGHLAEQVAQYGLLVEKLLSGDDAYVKSRLGQFAALGPLGKALAVAAVVGGIAAAGGYWAEGKGYEALKEGLKASGALLEVLSGAARAASTTSVFHRLLPLVSAAADLLQLGEDAGGLVGGKGNAGDAIKVLGSLLSLAGNFPPAALLKVVGAILHAAGGAIDDFINGEQERRDTASERARLYSRATGLDEASALEVVCAHPATLRRLRELGFSEADIRALAADPRVDLSDGNTAVAAKVAALFGLDAAATAELVRMVAGGAPPDMADGPLARAWHVLQSLVTADSLRRGDLRPLQQQVLEALDPQLAGYVRRHQGQPRFEVVDPWNTERLSTGAGRPTASALLAADFSVRPEQYAAYPGSPAERALALDRIASRFGAALANAPEGVRTMLEDVRRLGVDAVDLFHGSHVVVQGDGGVLYERWRQLGATRRSEPSSHYKEVPVDQYELEIPGVGVVLFGKDQDGNTWFQLEAHKGGDLVGHGFDTGVHGATQVAEKVNEVLRRLGLPVGSAELSNVGPAGLSPRSEKAGKELRVGYPRPPGRAPIAID